MNVKKPGPGALDSLQAELGSNPGSLVPKAIAQGPALPCPLHRPQLCQHQGRGGRLVVFSPGHTAPPSGFLANVCGRPGQQQLASSTLQMSKGQPQGQGRACSSIPQERIELFTCARSLPLCSLRSGEGGKRKQHSEGKPASSRPSAKWEEDIELGHVILRGRCATPHWLIRGGRWAEAPPSEASPLRGKEPVL